MPDITKIKVNGDPENSYQLYPRNKEFAKRSDTQPDWNQNDVSAPDYVKNRTHWEDPEVLGDIVAQNPNLTLADWDGFLHGEFTLREELVIGDTYKVSINGATGQYLVCHLNENSACLGSQAGSGFEIIDGGAGSGSVKLYNRYFIDSIDLTITHISSPPEIHKLDPKYLPNVDLEIRVNSYTAYDRMTSSNTQIISGSVEGACRKLLNRERPNVVITYFSTGQPGYTDTAYIAHPICIDRYSEYLNIDYIIGSYGNAYYLHSARFGMNGTVDYSEQPKKLAFDTTTL